jgi:putative peptidoglycan lipid II flippase
MLKSTGAMGAATLTSRVLGMLRETVYAGFMGDGPVAGAFKMALVVPNLFRRLLGEGALTAAFIPIFKEKEKREGEAEMWKAANAVVSGLVIAACVIIGLVTLGISIYLWQLPPSTEFSPGLLKAAPALNATPHTTDLADRRLMFELLRIMFPYMLLVCVAAIFMGMLNARGHFFVPALGATVLNVILIASVLFAAPFFGVRLEQQIFALAFAILVAGAAQALYQLPPLYKEGFRLRWVSPWGNPTVQQVVRKMIPGMMGVAAFQLNLLVTYGFAYFFVNPMINASFDYAVRLMEFPQGLFGISLATYLLPTLSGLAAEKNYPEFRSTYKQAAGYLLFINLIAAILLFVLAEPVIRLLFQHGKFDASSTARAAFALSFLAPGLLAFSMVNITARAFYALGDTQTPMKISAVCLVLNMIFTLILIKPMEQGGMALANTLSGCFNVYLLVFGLKKKLSKLDFAELRSGLLPMAGSGLAAGIAAWLTLRFWSGHFGHEAFWARVGEVFLPITAGMAVYIGLLCWSGLPQARDIVALAFSRFAKAEK